ncbi:MAG TPA: hypothetical protein VI756_32650 [Blastocatellia bacterium]
MSLKIRPEQLEAFQPVADAAFAARLAKYLRANHADAVVRISSGAVAVARLPEATLTKIVRSGMSRARGYGLTSESSLAAFIVLMFLAAPNFDAHPLIQRVLQDKDSEPDNRINNLWARVSPQNWKAVYGYYDTGAWSLDEGGP